MKSKLPIIFIGVIILVIALSAYFFVFKKDNGAATPSSGLVSSNTGAGQGLQNQNATAGTDAEQTGSQVVQILRNLSVIQLNDAVFRNPAFAYLADISIVLPPASNAGRRNPFGPIGSDGATTTTTTGFAPTTN